MALFNDMKYNFKNVLFVGPHYSLRGGMAAVLKTYSQTIEPFNFLPTYFYTNPVAGIFYFLGAFIKLFWILVSNRQIRIIHIHTASRGSFFRKSLLVLLCKLFGRKTVLHIHGGEFRLFYNNAGFLKGYIRYILNGVDEVICLSDEWKVYFDSLTNKKKSIVLNNPVIIPARPVAKQAASPVSVLFLNHINKAKGIFDVLSFFKENKEWLKDTCKLVVAGAGESEQLEQFIVANNLKDIVDYKGWVEGKNKEDLIQGCDVFILTSYNEGLPVSILEAMAYKKAIISTNVGGIPRIVLPGKNGWLTAPGDTAALATIFKEIKNNIAVLDAYGKRSFEIVQDYSPAKVNETLGRIYEGLAPAESSSVNQYNYEKNKQSEAETY
jgi:glycosyltransferase involved in cell wall biosynthesis